MEAVDGAKKRRERAALRISIIDWPHPSSQPMTQVHLLRNADEARATFWSASPTASSNCKNSTMPILREEALEARRCCMPCPAICDNCPRLIRPTQIVVPHEPTVVVGPSFPIFSRNPLRLPKAAFTATITSASRDRLSHPPLFHTSRHPSKPGKWIPTDCDPTAAK
jgi:hypothetical protein